MATNEKALKVGVIGMGPIGQILAAHLKEAGCEVAVCDRDRDKMALIRKEGIRIEGKVQKSAFFDCAYTSSEELARQQPDVIIIAVKVYHTETVIDELLKADNKKMHLICAQNGIDVEEKLIEAFGEQRSFRMVLNFAGNLLAPNVVSMTFFNAPNYVASLDDSQEAFSNQFAGLLTKAALDTVVINSFALVNKAWEKTILNSSLSALCGITRLTIREAVEHPDMAEIAEQLIEEAVQVARAEDIHFGDNFVKLCMRYLRRAGNHFPSLAVDMMNNRQTEIDYMNGQFVKYGRKHYLRTPLHLILTNLVKAHTRKGAVLSAPEPLAVVSLFTMSGTGALKEKSEGDHFVGVDLGSYYTKITVVDSHENVVYRELHKTLNRDKNTLYKTLQDIDSHFNVEAICATGYGREHFPNADLTKTEVSCAAYAISRLYPGRKNIIDIGAEDIKLIRSASEGKVEEFYMNNKCAAGTGAFITEVAERAEIDLRQMSDLAARSSASKELNSFCTVFAKTEIMSWIFDEMPVNDIAKGIYLSIANRIYKLKMEAELPIYLVGGVIAYHPYFRNILADKFNVDVIVPEYPQFMVSLGAALYAKQFSEKKGNQVQEKITIKA